ncbi:MAG: hypothetical protein ACLSUT_02945 [Christensenellales bacterium]
MKIWILVIFRLSSVLERQIEALDKKIERIALNPFGVTEKQYAGIIELSDRRIRLLNMRAMYDVLIRSLSGEEIFLIAKYAFGLSAAEIAELIGVKQGAAYKRIIKAVKRAEKLLADAGFDEERMQKEYLEFSAVVAALNALKGKSRSDR